MAASSSSSSLPQPPPPPPPQSPPLVPRSTDEKVRLVDELLNVGSLTRRTASGGALFAPGSPVRRLQRDRMQEREEDEKLILDVAEPDATASVPVSFHVQPACIKGGTMRSYQLEALNWMIALYDQKSNGILADEMGLGKTLETISILGYLKAYRNVSGPHLIIVPKSTSSNWVREVRKWCPSLSVFKYHGSKDERKELRAQLGTTDVCITTYEVTIIDSAQFKKVKWEYIVIDEAHRIKNEHSKLSAVVRILYSRNRLLVTGTPLQNNLHELWALLNFLLPAKFPSAEDFTDAFNVLEGDHRQSVTERLHKILRRYLLRRLKVDVEKDLPPKTETKLFIGLSDMQQDWYRKILAKDVDVLNSKTGQKMRLLNILMQLRKVCNHPYLFHGAEPGPPYTEGEHLIEASGKMVLLDKLLARLHETGSRVLIFSQMTRMLDILEDYCWLRQYEYCRIDGSTKQDDRDEQMDSFNAPDSSKFLFLLSTRAGGLGINLQTADTVILFDSDWNPQMDLQAQDRAHRIGQKKPVHVYRFVSEGTCEEKLVQRATEKLFLDALVIQAGRLKEKDKHMSPEEVQKMVRFGAQRIFEATNSSLVTDEDVDAIIERGQTRTAEENEKLKSNCDYNLLTFSVKPENHTSVYQYEGEDYRDKHKAETDEADVVLGGIGGGGGGSGGGSGDDEFEFIQLPSRNSASKVYDVNKYYREALRVGPGKDGKAREFRPPTRYDWQFFELERLEVLERQHWESRRAFKELMQAYKEERSIANALKSRKKSSGGSGGGGDANAKEGDGDEDVEMSGGGGGGGGDEMSEEDRIEAMKVEAKLLDEDELEELTSLQDEGFGSWKKMHFTSFLRAMETYGRNDLKQIRQNVVDKDPKDVDEYYYTFWERVDWLPDRDAYLSQIERGETKLDKIEMQNAALKAKYKKYKDPKNQLVVPYPNKNSTRTFNEEEDRFFVCMLYELGYGYWAEIKRRIHLAWQFRFDWFLKSRSDEEIRMRCQYLLRLLEKEHEDDSKRRKRPAQQLRVPVPRPGSSKSKGAARRPLKKSKSSKGK